MVLEWLWVTPEQTRQGLPGAITCALVPSSGPRWYTHTGVPGVSTPTFESSAFSLLSAPLYL